MNVIFALIFIISTVVLVFTNPNLVLKAITDGGTKAVTLSLGLVAVYSVWSGLMKVAEDCKLLDGLSKLLNPLTKRLFPSSNEKTRKQITINLSANVLGLGGIATPSGISATTLLCDSKDFDGACLLFILASTSLQIIPSTVISLRQTLNSVNPADIFLPSFLSSLLSTVVGVFLFYLTTRRVKCKR